MRFNQDKALAAARKAAETVEKSVRYSQEEIDAAIELLVAFKALDQFLTQGGQPPDDWCPDYGGQLMEGEVPMDQIYKDRFPCDNEDF